MNREVHVRFWERPEVKALRATRHCVDFATSAVRPISGQSRTCPCRTSADPNTHWLENCVDMDNKGFVITGEGFATRDTMRKPMPLETSMPGVFAIGDVRAGSTKRVGAGIGEGAAVVAQIHQVLALAPQRVQVAAE